MSPSPSSSRSRRAWSVALLATVVLAACSSGGSSEATSTTTVAPTARVRVTPGQVTVVSAGPAAQLADADRDAVFAAVGSYVQDATVAPLEGKQVPDRIIMRTCGTATSQPFPCKVHVYRKGLWVGRYGSEVAVVFEDVRGQWVVSQWL